MKSIMTMCLIGLMVAIAGCATPGSGKVTALNPVQIAAIACPQLNLLHDQFSALNVVLVANPATASSGVAATKLLATVDPLAHAVCTGAMANPNVNLASLQSLIQTGLPALTELAKTIPMTPQQQAAVQGGLAVSETMVALVNALQSQAAPATTSSVGK